MTTNIIISDFDETITKNDTIEVFAQLGLITNPNPDDTHKWSHFTDTYMEAWNKYHDKAPPRKLPLLKCFDNKTITDKNYKTALKNEIEYQDYLNVIELESLHELTNKSYFVDTRTLIPKFTKDCLANGSIEIRKGFRDLLNKINSTSSAFYVVSVNWSTDLILNILDNDDNIDESNIFCNSLNVFDGNYDGSFSKQVVTGADKIDSIETIISLENQTRADYKFWFIGDSETDLLAILNPNVNGVLLIDPTENEKKFIKVVKDILGVSQRAINKFLQDDVDILSLSVKKSHHNKLYLAKSWDGISKVIYDNK